jgi:hypothetical protein
VSLLAIAATISLLVLRSGRFPVFVDIYYHLSIMEMFDQAGGIVTHDFLQFAPEGRSHLYPPLLHILMMMAHKAGASSEHIGAFVSAGAYPLILMSIWYVLREMISRKAACLAILFMLSSWSFFYTTAIVSAAGLATILALWAYLLVYRGRWLSASIVLALCIYSHLSYPHLISVSLVLIAGVCPLYRKNVAKTIVLAYALASPWLAVVLANTGAIAQTSMDGGLQQAGFPLLAAAIAGAAISLKSLLGGKTCFAFPLAMMISMLPILLFYPSRFFVHGTVPLSMLGGIALDWCIVHMGKRAVSPRTSKALIGGALVLMAMTGTIVVASGGAPQQTDGPNNVPNPAPAQHGEQRDIMTLRIRVAPSVIPALISDDMLEQPSYLQSQYSDLIRAVSGQTEEQDVVVLPSGPTACMVTAFTGRATTSGMFRETAADTGPPDNPATYRQYKVFTGSRPVTVLADAKSEPPAAFPWWAAGMLLIVALLVIWIDAYKRPRATRLQDA